MAVRIQLRRDTAANWVSANPVLRAGEIGIETDTLKFKIGTGATWTATTNYANVTPSGLSNSLGNYILLANQGKAGGPSELNLDGDLVIPENSIVLWNDDNYTYSTTVTATQPTADRTITLPNNSGTVALTSDLNSYAALSGATFTGNIQVPTTVTFEGATADSYETALVATDPTADRTITLPDRDGTVITTGDTGTVTNTMLAGSIANNKLANSSVTINGFEIALGGTAAYSTDNISEGTVNKYFSNELAQDAVAAALAAGTHTNITVNYNDAANSISLTGAQTYNDEMARDAIGAALTGGTGIVVTPNDNADTITVAVDSTIATKTYADNAVSTGISNLVGGATSALDTLNELATALGNDANFSTTVTNALATKAPLNSPTFTGTVTLPTGTVTSGMILDGTIVNADINASAAIALSKLATDPLARANHTGTQLANTISDFDTQVRTSKVTDLTAPTTSFSMNSQKITNLADPVLDQDAATKAYVDAATAGLNVHASVKAATTTNVNLANAVDNNKVLDGYTLSTGDRILIKNQNTAADNGVYIVASNGAPTRATDYNQVGEVDAGDFIFVENGTVNGKTGWVQTNAITTLGTDPIAFTQFSGAGTYLAGNGLTLTGNTFSINTGTTVDLNTAQILTNKTITGTFTGNLTGNVTGDVSGNSGTVTNGVYTNGSYSNPSWLTALGWSKITSTPTTLAGYGITDALSSSTAASTYLPLTGGTISSDLTVAGNLTVNGSTTTISSTTLSVTDKNIEIAKVTTPTNITADGAGITVKGATDKTFNWVAATTAWTSSEDIDLASGKVLKIAGTQVLSASQYTGNAATVTNGVYTTGSYSNPSWITSLGWSKISSTPTTIAGYGITNAVVTDAANTITAASASTRPLIIKGAASQSVSLQEWQNSAGTVLALQQADGIYYNTVGIYTPSIQPAGGGGPYLTFTANSSITATSFNATHVPFAVKGFTSQTANLQEWKNSSGTVLANIDSSGNFVIGRSGGGSLGNGLITLQGPTAQSFYSNDNTSALHSRILFLRGNTTGNIMSITSKGDTAQGVAALVISNGAFSTEITGFGYNGNIYTNLQSATAVGLTIKAASSQSASIQEWQNSSNGVLAKIASDGSLWAYNNILTGRYLQGTNQSEPYLDFDSNKLTVNSRNASYVGLVVKGVASQSANLQEWQNSSGTVLASVNASGQFVGDGSQLTGLTTALTTPSTVTLSANTATTVDTTALSGFTSLEYMVSLKQGSKVRTSKVVLQTDGTSVDMTEFAITETGGTMSGVVISATTSGSNAVLQATVTDASSTNVTVKLAKIKL